MTTHSPRSSSAPSSSPSPSTPTTPPTSARWCGSATSSTARSRATTTDRCPPTSCSPTCKPDEYRLLVHVGRRRPRRASSAASCVELPLEDGSKVAFWRIETAARGLGPRHRLGRLRARRADRARARPHDPAGVGGASRRPGPAHRAADRLRRDSRRTTPRGSSCATATRSSRSSATARSTSPGRSRRSSGCSPRPQAASTGLPRGAVVRAHAAGVRRGLRAG